MDSSADNEVEGYEYLSVGITLLTQAGTNSNKQHPAWGQRTRTDEDQ
jgi:hypothetical protein